MCLSLVLENPDAIRSRLDFNRYEFAFDSLYDADYLKQHLIVETAVFIKVYPVEKKQTDSFVYRRTPERQDRNRERVSDKDRPELSECVF